MPKRVDFIRKTWYIIFTFSVVGVVAPATPLQWEKGTSPKRSIMRNTYKYKIQSQKNTIRLGNMLDDMHGIHVHIMRLQRRYYRRYKKNISAYSMTAHIVKLKNRTKPHWKQRTGNIKTITIKRDGCGDYWICFSCDDADTPKPFVKTGESAGFDFGMKTFLTCSDGEKIVSPQFLKQSLNKLRTLNKSLSRKVFKSGNWYRAKRALSRHYRKVARQRTDWHQKLATDLCRRFDTLCFETLNIDGMKRIWGRKVSDLAFYQFVEALDFKCAKHDKTLLKIGQWTTTTKPCSHCGYTNENLTLSDRHYVCPTCKTQHDRDINAAINIKQAGLAA